MTEHELTTLQYAMPQKGADYKLYLFAADGFHDGVIWFTTGKIRYPDEEITAVDAKKLADLHVARGLECRITDAGDLLVAHWLGGKQIYPVADFWSLV
jgi:hypothetical protein